MLKGPLLHAHIEATVNTCVLLRLALQQPAMRVCTSQPINAATITSVTMLPEFKPLPPRKVFDCIGQTDASYSPNQWVAMRKARETFDPELGGPLGFDKWVVGAITINMTEAYVTHNTVLKGLRFPS